MAPRSTRGGTPARPAREGQNATINTARQTPTPQDDIRSMMEENDTLKEENDALKKENDDFKEENTNLNAEIERLQECCKVSEKQIIELQQKIIYNEEARRNSNLVHGRKGRGKNTINLGDMLKQCPQNLVNYGNISNLISNNIFRRYKFMPKGWEMWSEKENTMCSYVCSNIVFPVAVTRTEDKMVYWKKQIVPMVNKKLVCMKGNMTQQIKKIFIGMTYFIHFKKSLLLVSLECCYVVPSIDDCRNDKHPLVDEDGRIKFESGSKWSQYTMDIQYVAFCEHYASVLIGRRKLEDFYSTHPGKGLFHKLGFSDEAYICLIIRNNQDMWIHQCREKEVMIQNTTSPQKTSKKKRSRSSSKQKGSDESNILPNTSESPRPLWTGYKTGSRIPYLASGWSEDGEIFYERIKAHCKKRTTDENEEMHEIWMEHFGTTMYKVPEQASTQLPTLGEPEDDAMAVPEFDLNFDSDNEGGNRDGMEGDADNLDLLPV